MDVRWEVVYYETRDRDTPIEDFLNGESEKARAKCLAYIDQLEEKGFGLPASYIGKVRGDIWELRPEWSGVEYRFFYAALVNKRLVILHAIKKKRQKLRSRDIEIAEARYKEIIRRESHEDAS